MNCGRLITGSEDNYQTKVGSEGSDRFGRKKLRNTHTLFRPDFHRPMLASRTSTVRNAQRITRSFATVVDIKGIKVAAVDYNQPTSSLTVLVKAGSRFEPKQGLANSLKYFAFKVCHDSDIGMDLY